MSDYQNYLQIEPNEKHIAKLSIYTSGYKYLYIHVWESGHINTGVFIAFHDVIYFSGVTSWKGDTIFRLGTQDELKVILKDIDTSIEIDSFKLFITDTSIGQVKVIAQDAKLSDSGHPTIAQS